MILVIMVSEVQAMIFVATIWVTYTLGSRHSPPTTANAQHVRWCVTSYAPAALIETGNQMGYNNLTAASWLLQAAHSLVEFPDPYICSIHVVTQEFVAAQELFVILQRHEQRRRRRRRRICSEYHAPEAVKW